MRKTGDELKASEVVMVNDKMIQADVKELDTDEGWCEIFLPVFESQNVIDKDDGVDEEVMPLFDYEVKRLTGTVRIVDLAVVK